MTDTQENKLSSYLVTEKVLDQNITTFPPDTPYTQTINQFKTLIGDIRNIRQIQELDNSGLTDHKNQLEQTLIEQSLALLYALTSFAAMSNNPDLLNQINYTDSDLTNCRDTILYDRALLLNTKAAENQADLLVFQVTPELIAQQADTLEQYNQALPEKEAANDLSKAATANLKLKFDETDQLLKNKLDRLMRTYRFTNPTLYRHYFNSREIIDLGRRKQGPQTRITGIITNAVTGEPETGVAVSVEELSKSAVTSALGKFSIVLKRPGNFNLTVKKSGFQTISQPVEIKQAEHVVLNFELVVE